MNLPRDHLTWTPIRKFCKYVSSVNTHVARDHLTRIEPARIFGFRSVPPAMGQCDGWSPQTSTASLGGCKSC